LKTYNFISIGISLIFLMTGILILTNILDYRIYFGSNQLMRWMLGVLLVIYGIFRAYNAYSKIKYQGRKFHYWKPDDDE
jgi:NADH:ubiquinone oxidoreductase subunit 2 (subunit N)